MRAEGVEWRVRDSMAGRCSLCCGMIPHGELFLGANDGRREVCLSCILTAIQGILPGSPQQVVLEIDPEQPATGTVRYVLDVDGKPAGTASVDLSLAATGRYAPALLGTVCALLEARQQYQGTPNPRLYESTAGDGWCTGSAPDGERVTIWARRQRNGEEFWMYARYEQARWLFEDPSTTCGPALVERPDLEVLAWKRGPARPRFLDAREVTDA